MQNSIKEKPYQNLKTLMPFSMEPVGLMVYYSVKWCWIYFFIYPTLYAHNRKVYLEKHTSCNFITKLLWDLQYSKTSSSETERNSHNKVFYNYIGFPTQADHYLKRSLYPYVFFFLFSCFSSGKFEKTLVTCNVQKSDLFVFSFLTKEQKRKIPHFSIIWYEM